jgi:hypothetical protein
VRHNKGLIELVVVVGLCWSMMLVELEGMLLGMLLHVPVLLQELLLLQVLVQV